MTSKERVYAAIEFKNPDRIPFKVDSISPEAINDIDYADLVKEIENDFVHNPVGWYYEGCKLGTNSDEWGCTWWNLKEGNLGQVVGHPLADISALSTYNWPKPEDIDLLSAVNDSQQRGDKYFLLGYISIFERLINLRGFENLLIDIVCEEEHFLKMLELVLDHNIKLIERLLKLDPDGIFLADDWGTQLALLISPDLWKKHFYPAYKRMIDLILNAGKHVFFHSDGNVTAILPDLVNLGVNVFWIEYYVNKIDWVVANFGGKVAFLSLADTQTIELGTPQDIEKQTKEEISLLGRFNGGLIACIYLEHNERYKALTKAFVEYRNY